MTRIGVGGLINLERTHLAGLLLNDIRLFHHHAEASAAASGPTGLDPSNRQTTTHSDEPSCSQDITPDTATEQ